MRNRLVGFPLLLAATACASATTSNPRLLLEPKDGPKAHVYAHYSGGLTNRTVRTTFKADKNAHVLVGRLGGDGRIEILYPETPQGTTLVTGGKTYSAAPFNATYDGVPQLYSYASRMPRSYGARMSSYDGRGNGFIFIIAAQYPLFVESLDDHGSWTDSLEVDDYHSSYEPREAIKDLAEVLTRGMPYSLDYANAFTTTSFTGFADAAMDCSAMISALGYIGTWYNLRMMGMSLPWVGGYTSAGYYNSEPSWYSPYAGCGFDYDRRYLNRYGYRTYTIGWVNGSNWQNPFYRYGRYGFFDASYVNPPWAYDLTRVRVAGATTPTSEPAKKPAFSTTSRRPGFRNGNESGSAFNVTRPRFDGQRSKPSTWAPPIRETRVSNDRNDRYARSNSGSGNSSPGATGVTRTEGVTTAKSSPPPAPAQTHATPVSHKVPVVTPKDP